MTRTRSAVVAAPASEQERRSLRRCLAAAAVAHGALLLLPLPWTEVEAAPAPPLHVVHRLVNALPPAPPQPQPPERPPDPPIHRPTHVSVPVPEVLDDPPVEAAATLPPVDLEPVAKLPPIVPDGPPPATEPADDDAPVYVFGAVQPPEAVLSPPPAYPMPALRVRKEGIVVLQATIDREGRVTDLQVLRGAPLGMTEAALDAVRGWRFRPATLDDRPVAVYYHLTVRFQVK
jgi:protein TonB